MSCFCPKSPSRRITSAYDGFVHFECNFGPEIVQISAPRAFIYPASLHLNEEVEKMVGPARFELATF